MRSNSLPSGRGNASWSRIALAVAVCLSVVLPAAADPTLQDGLIAYWPFDDAPGSAAAVDVINGNNAILAGGTFTFGQIGGGLQFNGLTDGANVPNSPSLNPETSALTISAWVQANQFPSLLPTSFGAIYDSRQDSYVLYQDGGKASLRFKVTTMNDVGAGSGAARPGINEAWLDTNWHHVVGVYDGGSASIYFDGKLIHSAGISGTAGRIMANQVAGFGMQPGLPDAVPPVAPSDFFDGTVDDTAIWNRALSKAEIAYLYNGGVGRAVTASNPTLAPDPIVIPDPVLHYKFDGNLNNSGTLGAAYNGRLVGATGTASYLAGQVDQALDLQQIANNQADGVHVEVDYTLPDKGTIVLWAKPKGPWFNYNALLDNSIHANQWEMWVYNDGRAAFRSSGADGIATYDLDNLDGPDHWYQFAISWFRDEVPEGWGLTGTSVGTSMFINGKHVTGSDGNLSWVDPGTTFAIGGGLLNAPGQVTIDDFRLYDVCLTTAEILSLMAPPPARPGDANRDGVVDDKDASILGANWLVQGGATWEQGDFNEDGNVNDTDAAILASHWGETMNETNVPEPCSITLLVWGAIAGLMRWKHQR